MNYRSKEKKIYIPIYILKDIYRELIIKQNKKRKISKTKRTNFTSIRNRNQLRSLFFFFTKWTCPFQNRRSRIIDRKRLNATEDVYTKDIRVDTYIDCFPSSRREYTNSMPFAGYLKGKFLMLWSSFIERTNGRMDELMDERMNGWSVYSDNRKKRII